MKADLTEKIFFCVFLAETTLEGFKRRTNFSKDFFWNFFKNNFFLNFSKNSFFRTFCFFSKFFNEYLIFCVIDYKKSSVFSGLLISILCYSFGISLALEKLMAVIMIVSSKKLGEKKTLIFKEKSGKIKVRNHKIEIYFSWFFSHKKGKNFFNLADR